MNDIYNSFQYIGSTGNYPIYDYINDTNNNLKIYVNNTSNIISNRITDNSNVITNKINDTYNNLIDNIKNNDIFTSNWIRKKKFIVLIIYY